jgi:hypothetical protein
MVTFNLVGLAKAHWLKVKLKTSFFYYLDFETCTIGKP